MGIQIYRIDKDSPELTEALRLYVKTFKSETITRNTFNFEHKNTTRYYYDVLEQIAPKVIDSGGDIFVAKNKDEVVGIALVREGHAQSIAIVGVNPFKLLRLVSKIKVRQALTISKLSNLSKPLEGKFITLQAIAVSNKHQGKGIGKKIFFEIHDLYKNTHEGIYLYTADEKNRDLYQHFGYEMVEQKSNNNLTFFHMIHYY